MNRDKLAPNLQQFLSLAANLKKDDAVSRIGDNLVINLQDMSPFSLFTGLLNTLGHDPLLPLGKIQVLINDWRELFGVQSIIFRMDEGEYSLKTFEPAQTWLELGKDANHVAPTFHGVQWELLR